MVQRGHSPEELTACHRDNVIERCRPVCLVRRWLVIPAKAIRRSPRVRALRPFPALSFLLRFAFDAITLRAYNSATLPSKGHNGRFARHSGTLSMQHPVTLSYTPDLELIRMWMQLGRVMGAGRDAAPAPGSADPSESDQIGDLRRDMTSTQHDHHTRSEAI